MKYADRLKLQEAMTNLQRARAIVSDAHAVIDSMRAQELAKYDNLIKAEGGLVDTDMGAMIRDAYQALDYLTLKVGGADIGIYEALREYLRTPALSNVALHAGNNQGRDE